MSSRVFLSLETELFFVKTHIIHALAETTSEAYNNREYRVFVTRYSRLSLLSEMHTPLVYMAYLQGQ